MESNLEIFPRLDVIEEKWNTIENVSIEASRETLPGKIRYRK